jgi:hypothetical protein
VEALPEIGEQWNDAGALRIEHDEHRGKDRDRDDLPALTPARFHLLRASRDVGTLLRLHDRK